MSALAARAAFAFAAAACSAAVLAACATTPDAADDVDTEQPYVEALDGCRVKVDSANGRTVLCGQTMGALVLAKKTETETLVDTFLEGVGKGAGVTIEREPADREIGGMVSPGTHAWFTNKAGALVDGWLGVVTAGGDRRLVGCFVVGQGIGDRCPSLLVVLRDAPLMAAGRYPVDVLGARALAADGCDLMPNRASCGTYELQWYENGADLPVERFVENFEKNGSRVATRTTLPCRTSGTVAACEKVALENESGNVDVYFAYPPAGGVLLCIVETGKRLEPMCRTFMSVEEP